ncbi:MATH domain and coiled-coil domain-containing protein At3g58250-like [Vigna radiata var. radiata]|uniref:MATH domain and coiled-coil domain-containing protein At3g58250-like n=1 Tax=Vigna radiata var. radiata TaxID=3916 RepID=A0A1S3VAN2_VIGRR|nr:MATH domain and coiled-coil domain-containing protein At3g58250-like [Vigna radiata var. radiata]
MENDNKRPKLTFEKYTWRINNFSKLKNQRHHSDNFILDGFSWYMVKIPVGRCFFKIYLEADENRANLPEDWKRTENISLAVNDQKTIRQGLECEFNADVTCSKHFVFLNDINEPSSGFIVNDACMIEVGIFVIKNVYENEQYWTGREIDKDLHTEYPLFHEMFMRSFANIDLNYVPLLENICLLYPYLLVSQEKRSCKFTEWAFTALGRLLYFLNTKQVKDMDDEACDHLKKLWDEVKIFGFDLSWLESDVKSALNLKNYTDKIANVRKAKERVDDLEIRTQKLKAEVIERETEFERAKTDLVKAEEGFKERNLDDILGYRSKKWF